MKSHPPSHRCIRRNRVRIVIPILLSFWMLLQSGCIIISTAGTVATTAVKSTVSIAGHTAKTAIDVVTPDGDDDESDNEEDSE